MVIFGISPDELRHGTFGRFRLGSRAFGSATRSWTARSIAVRPILMTSCTTIFGLLPLVLFSEYTDANIWNALGFALIGGLASSTVFALSVTPAVYLLFERQPERKRLLAAGGVDVAVVAGAMRDPNARSGWRERMQHVGRLVAGLLRWWKERR
jgi:hypothetical protein